MKRNRVFILFYAMHVYLLKINFNMQKGVVISYDMVRNIIQNQYSEHTYFTA